MNGTKKALRLMAAAAIAIVLGSAPAYSATLRCTPRFDFWEGSRGIGPSAVEPGEELTFRWEAGNAEQAQTMRRVAGELEARAGDEPLRSSRTGPDYVDFRGDAPSSPGPFRIEVLHGAEVLECAGARVVEPVAEPPVIEETAALPAGEPVETSDGFPLWAILALAALPVAGGALWFMRQDADEKTLHKAKSEMSAHEFAAFCDGLRRNPDFKKQAEHLEALAAKYRGKPDNTKPDEGDIVLADEYIRKVGVTKALLVSLDLIEWVLGFLPNPGSWLTKWFRLMALRKALRNAELAKEIDDLIKKVEKLKKLKKGWDETQEAQDLMDEIDRLSEQAEEEAGG